MKDKIIFTLLLFAALSSLMLSCAQSADTSINRGKVITEINMLKEIREKIDLKKRTTYDSIEYRLAKNNSIAGNYKDIAFNVEERTDELVTFIQGLKIEIVMTAEGQGSDAIIGNDIDADKISRLNNTKVPAAILLGENNDGKAMDLKAIIQEYQRYLIQVSDDDPLIVKNIDIELNTDDIKRSEPGKNNEETVPWEQFIFRDQPVGSVLVILTGIQNNAKNAESEVLSFILNKINSQI